MALAAAGHFGYRGDAFAALATLLTASVALPAVSLWLARRGVLDVPLLRRTGVNLVARRGDPAGWLIAHLDSKSQPVSIVARAAAFWLLAIVWLGAVLVAAGQLAGGSGGAPRWEPWWPWLVIAGVVAAIPIVLSTVGERSPGAVDNATGVVTVLLAAGALPGTAPVGVLLTSAEELGLAGARAWARQAPPSTAVNCDGVDDRGMLTCMTSGFGSRGLAGRAREVAQRLGLPLRVMRLLPGVLVDGVALADAGWNVVTVSRVTMRTLARIHRPGDSLEAVSGNGAVDASRFVAELLWEAIR